ncbi:MAG: cytochrome c biogenesis protein CcsA [Ignavibacteriaceae bacterium]|jgi:cytochrome c-type biogenesis protein CcmF
MAGSILITLALAFSIFSMVMYYYTYRGAKNTLNIARMSFHAMAMFVIIASAFLMYLIITHQYQYEYVYSYSSDDLPFGYLLATFWAGQQGSFMLWLFVTALIGVFLQSYTGKRDDLEPRVMMVFGLATTFLLVMVSPLMKNPFAFIWAEPMFIETVKINSSFLSLPFMQNFMFSDPNSGQNFVKMSKDLYATLQGAGISINQFIIHGKGLNPLLQNFWMQIHPPILFTGFAMTTVPFSFAMAALIKNDYKDWVRQSFPWILAGSGILGLGIMLGGYWAYGVLGWGGYWAWDPVENASLVPWLISVAGIHTMIVQRKTQAKGGIGKFVKINLLLSILAYVMVLYSTFLTRSGVLGDASVHSFVDPGTIVYLFLIIFVGTFLLLGVGMIIYRWKYLESQIVSEESLLARELALFTAAVTIGASALIVAVGTSAPIFKQSVETKFYNEMHVPLAIIIGFLNGFSFLLKWRHSSGEDILKKSKFSLIATGVFAVLIILFGKVYDIMMILLTVSAAFAFFVNAEIAYKIFTGNKKMLGAYIAHIGISLFILGVVGSSAYSKQVEVDLTKGKPVQVLGHTLEFTSYNPIENNTKYEFNVSVKDGNGSPRVIKPIMFISTFNNSLMREPDILEGFTKDFYISPLSYDDGSNAAKNPQGNAVTLMPNEKTSIEGAELTYADFIKPDMSVMMSGGNFQMGAKLTVTKNGKTETIEALMKKAEQGVTFVPVELKDADLRVELTKIDPTTKKAEFIVGKLSMPASTAQPAEILAVNASTKPFISLVWIGVAVVVIGFFVSTLRRLKESWA